MLPIKNTRPERLKLTIQNHRLQCKQLEVEISKIIDNSVNNCRGRNKQNESFFRNGQSTC